MTIKALVVDNNPVHLKAVSSILAHAGCEVVLASNGLEALEIMQKKVPDILFTDLVMPMVDGEKLCRIVRGTEQYKSIFVVLLSAIILEDRERILSEIDCDICIAKGTLEEMRKHLHQALRQFEDKVENVNTVLGDGQKGLPSSTSVTRELLTEKEHLQQMLENLSEAVIELSFNGRILSLNKAAMNVWDYKREDVIGLPVKHLEFGHHSTAISKWCDEEVIGKGGKVLEVREDDPLRIRDRVLTASLLPVPHGEEIFALCIFRDISRQYFAEKQKEEMDNALKLLHKMEAMSFMAGGVAHDFNNLLTVICGNLDMISLGQEGNDTKNNAVFLENAKKSAYSAVELVRKISNFSPFGIVRRSNVALGSFLENIVRDFFDDVECGYSFTEIDRRCSANIDEAQVETAVRNVLQNAVEAQGRKPVEISLKRELIADQTIRAGQYIASGKYVKITIKDWGGGIDRENIYEIFDPYYSSKERSSLKGMGLGLTIVYSTLRNHAGYVIVDSEPGEWTTVSLYLPQISRDIDYSDKNHGILFVEENAELRTICKIMLEYMKYKPIVVEDSVEALQVLRHDRANDCQIGTVVVSLSEGGKKVGIELCKKIDKIDPGLKTVICSATTFDPVMKNYSDFGFAGALAKPYTIDDLRKMLSDLHSS